MLKRFKGYLPLLLFAGIVLYALGTSLGHQKEKAVETSPSPVSTEQKNTVVDIPLTTMDQSLSVETKTIKEKGKGYSISIEYPQLRGMGNVKTQDLINKKLKPNVVKERKDLLEAYSINPHPTGDAYINETYTVTYATDYIVSILITRFFDASISAGAMENTYTANYELFDGKEIKIDDFFVDKSYPDTVLPYIKAVLKQRFPEHAIGEDLQADDLKKFLITQEGIAFVFDKYRVLPGAYGFQSVVVPYSALKDVIDSDGIFMHIARSFSKTSASDTECYASKDSQVSFNGTMRVFVKNCPRRPTIDYGRSNNEIWIEDLRTHESKILISAGPKSRYIKEDSFFTQLSSLRAPIFSINNDKVFFITSAWVTSGEVFAFDLKTQQLSEVTPGNALGIITKAGPYRGMLVVNQHRYYRAPEEGSYDQNFIVQVDGTVVKEFGKHTERDRMVSEYGVIGL